MPVTMRRRTCGAVGNALDVDAGLRAATHADARLQADASGCDGGVREEQAALRVKDSYLASMRHAQRIRRSRGWDEVWRSTTSHLEGGP
jgi:hypothetical protein